MSIRMWFRLPRVRRGIAASAVVLAAGGLVLARTPASAGAMSHVEATVAGNGQNRITFTGPGAHGVFAVSHSLVLAGGERRVFAELDLTADKIEGQARERAPISMAVVLDTSGSMGGEKIEEAKRSIEKLLRDMRDDDEIALVRYSSDASVVQPLARVGEVRASLIGRVRAITADGGTNIPRGLSTGLAALEGAARGRVRRVVLASDGLDSTRAMAEKLARDSSERGITVSSMGIGLDFDEGYMGGLAQAGRGNFAFVKDASSLATFLHRELEETAATTIERATARVKLPAGVRFVRAIGAEARALDGGSEIELSLGSLFAGDERRVVMELAATIDAGKGGPFEGKVAWSRVGGEAAEARLSGIALSGSSDARAVEEGRDGAVLATAMSALASVRQIEAAAAYGRGDVAGAQALVDDNMAELKAAAAAAPAATAAALDEQMREYDKAKKTFASAPPTSTAGRAAAKAIAAKDNGNLSHRAY